jgi:8-oxo-dGTP pyrophosphatase MutT (NUDIX family)
MSLLRHIENCNRFSPDRFRPLLFGTQRIGFVRHDIARHLNQFPGTFAVTEDAVRLVASGDFEAISGAVDRIAERLTQDGIITKWRNECFAVTPRWGEPPLFKIDRGAVPVFGVKAYGVHLNGYQREPDGTIRLWIGRRAPDKKVEPNKLDNLVAGGIGYPHGIADTLIKEADEEAGMSADLASRAVPRGHVAYRMEWGPGTRDDVLYVYDLETPADFVPRNGDGELVAFDLMDAHEVLDRVRDTDDFKFNVNLIIIDFALRHGLIDHREPDYHALVEGLRRSPD